MAYETEEYIYEGDPAANQSTTSANPATATASTIHTHIITTDGYHISNVVNAADGDGGAAGDDNTMIMFSCDDNGDQSNCGESMHPHAASTVVEADADAVNDADDADDDDNLIANAPIVFNDDGKITIIMAPPPATATHLPATAFTAVDVVASVTELAATRLARIVPIVHRAVPTPVPTAPIASRTTNSTTGHQPAKSAATAAATASGGQRFACDCGKSYRSEASFRFHQYECGKEPAFGCPYCDYRAMRNTTLTKHVKSKHMPAAAE